MPTIDIRRSPGGDEPAAGLIQPTADEAKNGWTPESLTAYVRGREKAHGEAILERPKARPARSDGRYDPHFWRGR